MKFVLFSKRFYTLGAGLAIHVLVLLGVFPEGNEGVLNEQVANIVAIVFEAIGAFVASKGGAPLTVVPSKGTE